MKTVTRRKLRQDLGSRTSRRSGISSQSRPRPATKMKELIREHREMGYQIN